MLSSNLHKKNKRVLFPEDTVAIIRKLAEKYGIGENAEESLEKIRQGKTTNGAKIAATVMKTAQDNISCAKMGAILEEELNLPPEKAKSLAEDLDKEVLALIEKNPLEQKKNQAKAEEKISVKKSTPIKDAYRELSE